MMKKKIIWSLWAVSTTALLGYLSMGLFANEKKDLFLPGPVMHGHHQVEMQCSTCHTDPFGGGEVLQDACTSCHAKELKTALDSHPKTKFTDPRNADRLELIDARFCVACHLEHQPELMHPMGVSEPEDFCVHCHQDIGEERESHVGLEMTTCGNSGCHNFHDNKALYEEFLLDHKDEPDLLPTALLPTTDQIEVKIKTINDQSIPNQFELSDPDHKKWLASDHAQAGMQCQHCHGEVANWSSQPEIEVCADCHKDETDTFGLGMHGFPWKQGLGLAKVSDSFLPMHSDAVHKEVDCQSCHGSHDYDIQQAAVESCLGCHDDTHSNNFKASKHFQLFEAELNKEVQVGSGVTCATCHMPRMKIENEFGQEKLIVNHNQSDVLQPNEKMIRPVCMNCHGLGFSINALADEKLIKNNFQGAPSVHVESIDWAVARDK